MGEMNVLSKSDRKVNRRHLRNQTSESLHTARKEMTIASIFEKIDACDELDGNTLLELCKGGPAKMVRGIYQTAKHHMEMLDTFRDLMAQDMTRAWGHSVFAKLPRDQGHRCRGVVATCTSLSPLAWPVKQFSAR